MGNSVVGLDIGSTALRGVELSGAHKAKPNLLRFFEVPLPPGAVSRGEVVDENAVGVALKKLWSEGGFKSKKVVLGMGNQRVLVRDLSVPKMSLKRIRESLPFQVQSMLQIPPADSLLDFYPISESTGEHGAMINGLLVAAEKSAILGNILAAERAGLTPLEVDLIPFALNRLLLTRSSIKGTVALIDVGGNTTSIIISCDGVPWFVRIIAAGGEDLTQALKSGLEIETDQAEELKRTLRADWVNAEDPRAANIVQTVTNELLGSLRNTVNYFNNTRPQDPVCEVLLTGGGTRLPGFAKVLAEMTHLSVSDADPFATITPGRKVKSKKLEESRSSIAVALGLALGNLE